MVEFVDELWKIKYDTSRANCGTCVYYPSMPDPSHFYFDTEPGISGPPGMNPLRLLVLLSQHPYWSTVKVPGSDGLIDGLTHTMAELYAAAATTHGWPPVLDDWQNGGIRYNASQAYFNTYSYPNGGVAVSNRDVAVWYNRICQRVQDAVMKHCAYDVIAAKWPNAKFGNYDDGNCDGQADRVQRMQNPPPDLGGVATDQFFRLNMHKGWGGAQWATDTGIWFGLPTRTSGTTDSPVLYKLKPGNWTGYGAYHPGIRQDNLWRPGFPQESLSESSLRINRHTVESTLNSQPVTGVGRQAPWIGMVGVAANGQTQENYVGAEEARGTLAMLRAKNITEALYFTDWFRQSGPEGWQNTTTAWDQTREHARRVYAGRILTYARTMKTVFNPPPIDPLRLEFTLREVGNPLREREVEMESICTAPPVGGSGDSQCFTALVVDVEWRDALYAYEGVNLFDLNIECSVNQPNVTGQVYIWSPGLAAYTLFGTTSCGTIDPIPFVSPLSGADSRYRARVNLGPVAGPSDGIFVDADNVLKSRLKIVWTSTASFRSYVDLVQLIPLGFGGCGSSQMLSSADVNFDGTVDQSDLALFVEDWIAETEAADIDMNSSVTAEDLDSYVEAYHGGE